MRHRMGWAESTYESPSTSAAACLLIGVGVTLQLIVVGSAPLLTVGRLILGMGVGAISNAVPLYLSEVPPTSASTPWLSCSGLAHLMQCASKVIRGAVISSWQLMLAIGQVGRQSV